MTPRPALGLAARFGESRVFDTPLAEAGIVGTAIGMAMNGLRPVVEMQFDAFAYPAFEQITSHLAKLRNRTRGRIELPVVHLRHPSSLQVDADSERRIIRKLHIVLDIDIRNRGDERRARGEVFIDLGTERVFATQ